MYYKKIKIFFIFSIFCCHRILGQTPLDEFNPLYAVYNDWYQHNPSKWSTFVPSANKSCETFFYTDKVDYYLIELIEQQLSEDTSFIKRKDSGFMRYTLEKDTLRLSDEEKKYLLNELDSLNFIGWGNNLFPQSRVVPVSEVDELVRNENEKREPVETKLCSVYYTFTTPIFFRKNTFCLFYSGYSDVVSSEGNCWIYKKEKNGWIKFAPVLQWFK